MSAATRRISFGVPDWAIGPRIYNPLRCRTDIAVTFVFALVALSPCIRIDYVPYIDWVLAILLLIVSAHRLLRINARAFPNLLLSTALLLIAILTSSLTTPNPLLGVDYAFKIGFIYFALFPLFTEDPQKAKIILTMGAFLVVCNAFMLMAGLAGIHSLAKLGTLERWETALCPVGLLTDLAAGFVVYAVGLVLLPGRRFIGSILLGSCVLLLILGGGRTSLLIAVCELLCAGVMTAFITPFNTIIRAGAVSKACVLGTCLTLTIVCCGTMLKNTSSLGVLTIPTRLTKLLPSGSDSGSDWIAQQGQDRIEMYQLAAQKILSSPIWGTGPKTTDLNGTPVHNAYLQAWCDLGLLGFFAFVVFYSQTAVEIQMVCRRLRQVPPRQRLWVIQTICYTICFPILWLFNTFSTELSDLTLFVASAAYLYSFLGICRSQHIRPELHV